MPCHYPLRNKRSNAIEGLEGSFDELRIKEIVGKEEGLDTLVYSKHIGDETVPS